MNLMKIYLTIGLKRKSQWEFKRTVYTCNNQYVKINKKTIANLYYEADREEEQNIKLDKRNYSFYIIKLKKHLTEQKKSPQTIRIYLKAVKSFYNAYSIKEPDVTLSKGDIGLEQNYGRLLQKKEIRFGHHFAFFYFGHHFHGFHLFFFHTHTFSLSRTWFADALIPIFHIKFYFTLVKRVDII